MANALLKKKIDGKFLFFASGVSNSNETKLCEFLREKKLLKNTIKKNRDLTFIYFSTYSIHDKSVQNKPYTKHKLSIENFVSKYCANYYIFRLPNLVGKEGNPNTLFNFVVKKVKNKEPFTVWSKATRNLLDVEDCIELILQVLEKQPKNKTYDVINIENYKVIDIVKKIEKKLNINAAYKVLEIGDDIAIQNRGIYSLISDYFENLNLKTNYIDHIINKYL